MPGAENKLSFVISIAVGVLVFVAIIPYASADLWAESVIAAAIFLLGAVSILQPFREKDRELGQLLAPIVALAIYSFAQGLPALLVDAENHRVSAALPYSFDLTASFWCVLKFLALAVFIKLAAVDVRENVRFLIWSLVAAGNFFAVLGIFRFLLQAAFPDWFGWFVLPELRAGVGFGTFINQNHFAFLMLMNLGLTGGLCLYGGLEKKKRILLLILCALGWTAIILTASRGGIISSFVVAAGLILLPLAGFITIRSKRRPQTSAAKTLSILKRLAGVAALAGLAILGTVLIGQDRVVQRFEEIPDQFESTTGTDYYRRLDVWRAGAAMIEEHGIFGVGFGGFRYAVARYIDISGAVAPEQAHNDYLEFAASGGLVAVLCGIWFFYALFGLLKKRFSGTESRFETAARIGALGAFAGIAVHSFFDFSLQLAGNWLFCAALLAVAVCPNGSQLNGKNEANEFNVTAPKILGAAMLICLSILCLFFGYSRRADAFFADFAETNFARTSLKHFPFDAEIYQRRAQFFENAGDLAAAAESLRKAIRYRPNDYALPLGLAKVLQSRGETKAAENAFLRAIELAPRYGEPRLFYGKFLVASERKAEGFEQLRYAFRRSPQYFAEVAALAWRESGENAAETVRVISPRDRSEREKLAEFLLEKNEFAAIAEIFCGAADATEAQRAAFVTKLLEKRQFFEADRIFRRRCETAGGAAPNFIDGDFESGEMSEWLGFGWRVGNLPETIKLGIAENFGEDGGRSLSLEFAGNSEPSEKLISQTLIVEKNRRYDFSFAYRTEKIVSGGLPVVRVVLKEPQTDALFKEIELAEDSGKWITNRLAIQTGARTEALEIIIARQPCRDYLCPIIGELWLDDFTLK